MSSYAVLTRQARCAALGFSPGAIDGVDGPKTRAAYAAAVASQKAKGLPFIHASGLARIHGHWTAGGHLANAVDLKAYHVLVEGSGRVIQAAPHTAPKSHTLGANGGAIGVSMCAMAGAVERPFNAGSSPITPAQLQAFICEIARLSCAYDIPVTRWSVLTHAEIQQTLGIRQRNKWDITHIPGMSAPGDPIAVGDELRRRIIAAGGQA